MSLLRNLRLLAGQRQALALCRLNLDLAQLQNHLLRTSLLSSPHVQLLQSWLILSISPVQSQPVRSIQRKVTNGYSAMWAAEGEANIRTVVDTVRLTGSTPFGAILKTISD